MNQFDRNNWRDSCRENHRRNYLNSHGHGYNYKDGSNDKLNKHDNNNKNNGRRSNGIPIGAMPCGDPKRTSSPTILRTRRSRSPSS